MTDDYLSPEEQDLLAAEHALGLLQGQEHAEAARRYLRDPAFAVAVAGWQRRMGPLFAATPEAVPGPGVWTAISDAIQADNGNLPLRKLRWWQASSFVATGIAASLLVILLIPRQDAAVAPVPAILNQPVVVAQLRRADGAQVMVARFDDGTGSLRIRASGIEDQGGVPELWVIPAGGAPKSLGLLPQTGLQTVELTAANRALIAEGATLAISIEAAVGAPHNAPVGPIIATGAVNKI